MPRQLTLTTIGLPVRKELLIQSLLRLANAKTTDRWSWSLCNDDIVDVVIYEPVSMLSNELLSQARQIGTPMCVALTNTESEVAIGEDVLCYPLRAAELVNLLDRLSSRIMMNGLDPWKASRRQPSEQPIEPINGEFGFALTLQRLIDRDSRAVHRVNVGDMTLHVIPAGRALLLTQPLDSEKLTALFEATSDVRVDVLPDLHARLLIAEGAKQQPLDWLLWRAGLEGPRDRLISTLPSDVAFTLRRWPDFGRLKHDHRHLRMAAHMTRAALTIDELATSTDCSVAQVRAFVNACALCGLIKVRHRATLPAASVQFRRSPVSSVPSATRTGGIFRSIRLALGIGAS
jgi:hypothetical protein